MKKFASIVLQAFVFVPVLALGVSAFVPTSAFAAAAPAPAAGAPGCATDSLSIQNGANCAKGTDQATNLFGDGGIFQVVTNILLFIVGAIAVIMLIIGGIRYVVSGGDQAAVTAAKNTILYAIVGIIVAILAYAAVNFVTSSLATQA